MPLKPKTLSRVRDEAVKKATGKKWIDWFRILDKEKSKEKSHKEIAQWLYDNFSVSGWWSQMLTVEYEKEKGMRDLYQKPEGYEISVSKTFAIPLKSLYGNFASDKKRKLWLEENIKLTAKTVNKSLRAKWKDGLTRISVNFYAVDKNKSRAVVQHLKLADAKQANAKKTFWAKKLNLLAKINENK